MSHAYSIPVANEPAPVAADEVVLVARRRPAPQC